MDRESMTEDQKETVASHLKVVNLKPKQREDDSCRLPNEDEMQIMLGPDNVLDGIICITLNDKGINGYWIDGVSYPFAMGLMEMTKADMIGAMFDEE
jgi:hypothetical protein